jgi:hypothetical protein
MTPISKKMIIRGTTPTEVFDFISNPANDSAWRESTVSFEWLTDETEGVGSRIRATDRLAGIRINYDVEITQWERPRLYGAKSSGMATVEFTAELRPTPDSGTSVELNGEAEFNGILRLLGPLLDGQFQKQFDLEWDNLKRVLESADPESPAR